MHLTNEQIAAIEAAIIRLNKRLPQRTFDSILSEIMNAGCNSVEYDMFETDDEEVDQ